MFNQPGWRGINSEEAVRQLRTADILPTSSFYAGFFIYLTLLYFAFFTIYGYFYITVNFTDIAFPKEAIETALLAFAVFIGTRDKLVGGVEARWRQSVHQLFDLPASFRHQVLLVAKAPWGAPPEDDGNQKDVQEPATSEAEWCKKSADLILMANIERLLQSLRAASDQIFCADPDTRELAGALEGRATAVLSIAHELSAETTLEHGPYSSPRSVLVHRGSWSKFRHDSRELLFDAICLSILLRRRGIDLNLPRIDQVALVREERGRLTRSVVRAAFMAVLATVALAVLHDRMMQMRPDVVADALIGAVYYVIPLFISRKMFASIELPQKTASGRFRPARVSLRTFIICFLLTAPALIAVNLIVAGAAVGLPRVIEVLPLALAWAARTELINAVMPAANAMFFFLLFVALSDTTHLKPGHVLAFHLVIISVASITIRYFTVTFFYNAYFQPVDALRSILMPALIIMIIYFVLRRDRAAASVSDRTI